MNLSSKQFDYLIELYSMISDNNSTFLVKTGKGNNSIVSSHIPVEITSELKEFVEKSIEESTLSEPKLILESKEYEKEIVSLGFSSLSVARLFNCEFSDFYLLTTSADDDQENKNIRNLELIKESISERINYEENINKQYIETTSNINTVIYSTNAEGTRYHFISSSVERLFNLTAEQIIKNKFSLLRKIVPEYFGDYNKFIKKLKSGEKAILEYQYISGEKKNKRWVRHTGNPVTINGNVQRVVGIIEDITEEKNILSKLEKSEEKFRQLIETASDLIISLNSFGYVALVNRFGAKSLGYKPQELLGKHFLELIDESTKSGTIDAFQKILSSEDVTQFEAALIDKFENVVLYEFQATPTKDEGIISGMIALGRDVTKRKADEIRLSELNTKLTEANRLISIERDRAKQQLTVLEELNKLKNDFVSRVSHELRTPLASIVGFAETIVSDEDLPPELVSEFSNIILTEGKRLAKLVNDVLDFSKLEADENIKKENVNIIKILSNVGKSFEQFAINKKITMNFQLPESEIIIFADKEMMTKAFGTIVENGIKYNNPGGGVSVILQDFKNEIEVVISDTGIGIPENELPKLFEKFSNFESNRSPVGGSGLGLAYLKQVIDLHRGLIQVKSEFDKGTSFIIRLPKKN